MPRPTTPRPDVVALLRACKELPDEDVHRLVLSDWLEENADDPAEIALRDLIRTQVQLDALSINDDRQRPLAARGAALLREHGEAWLGSLDTDRVNWGLIHGLFVMTCHEEDLSGNLLGTPGFPEGWGWVERLTVLCTSSADLEAMAQASPLGQIGTLDLRRNALRARGARALAKSPILTDLCGLILSNTDLGRDGLEAITSSPYLRGLVRLELDGNGLDAACMTALGAWPGKRNLFRLSLNRNLISVSALVEGEPFERLRELMLSGCYLEATAIGALAAAPLRVRRLDLSRNAGIDSDAVKRLLSAEWVEELEWLDLGYTSAGDEGMRVLAGCERLTRLRHLGYAAAGLHDARAVRSLIRSPHLPNLRCLDVRLSRNDFSSQLRKAAADSDLTIIY